MNNNMENFQKKIEEMQRKLNIINEDIEEIKNERKLYDKNKSVYKANSFLSNNSKRKNFFEDEINANNISNNSIFQRKNFINHTYNSNINNTGRTNIPLNNDNFKLIDENIEEIPKNHYTISREINNNSFNININEINQRKDLTINYIDDFSNKTNNNIIRKYKSTSNTIDYNDEKNIKFQYGRNINNKNKKKENYESAYTSNSLYQNYCHMKKNMNDININSNNFNHSQTINANINKNSKSFKNEIKNKNSFSSFKCRKKIKKILEEKKVKKFPNINNKNYFNNEFATTKHKNKNIIYNNKTIDINNNYDYSFAKKKSHNNNENYKSNGPIKIKTRNNNILISNKNDNIKIKEKNNTVEDINLRNKRSLSIENPKLENNMNNSYKYNKNIKLNNINNFQDNKQAIFSNYKNNHSKTENTENKRGNNYKQLLLDIIDITNKYNNSGNKANMNNILEEYKLLLYDIKSKNDFIYKVINLYNITTNSKIKFKDNESLMHTWNWLINNQNKILENEKIENENKQYKQICKDIMKEYNLKSIEQLKIFIHKLCKKVDKNENFLEGIKKILLE